MLELREISRAQWTTIFPVSLFVRFKIIVIKRRRKLTAGNSRTFSANLLCKYASLAVQYRIVLSYTGPKRRRAVKRFGKTNAITTRYEWINRDQTARRRRREEISIKHFTTAKTNIAKRVARAYAVVYDTCNANPVFDYVQNARVINIIVTTTAATSRCWLSDVFEGWGKQRGWLTPREFFFGF